ncbi:uncharacterized protein LOC112561233 isoform X2 [Pomacea canaliculata]|uniref:uncharacterized protein LOC112561233 isoform X2 n=1 Tax=Pomacea canaliculata TaxID=400727 RepID=UPI000D733D0C|nr:uncharacterized protein LOC112561233 isoform X2 [Pomacea canaliculata]
MHRADFEVLCNWIGPLLPKERTISLEKKMLATLWFLGNQESFRGIGDRFNLSKGSLRRVIHLICHTLASHQKKWIKWPALAEMHENASQFQARQFIRGPIVPFPDPRKHNPQHSNGYLCCIVQDSSGGLFEVWCL